MIARLLPFYRCRLSLGLGYRLSVYGLILGLIECGPSHFGTNADFALMVADAVGLVHHGARVELLRGRAFAEVLGHCATGFASFAGVVSLMNVASKLALRNVQSAFKAPSVGRYLSYPFCLLNHSDGIAVVRLIVHTK